MSAVMAALGSTSVLADDFGQLSADGLTEETISAVEEGDAERVLDLLTEMRLRGMHFFENAPDPMCDREVSRSLPFTENIINWGLLNTSYGQFAGMVAMEAGTCACPRSLLDVSEFTNGLLGKDAEDVSEEDRQMLVDFTNGPGAEATALYRTFRREQCHGGP